MSEAPKRLLEGGGEGAQRAAVYRLLSQLPKDAQDSEATERRWKQSVWQRLQGQRSAPRVAWLALAPAAAVAALVLWLRPIAAGTRGAFPRQSPAGIHDPALAPPPFARLDEAVGRVEAGVPARDWREAHQGEALSARSRLRTDPSSHATIEIEGVAHVLVSPGSELAIADLGPETLLELAKGGVLAHVTKRPPGRSFSVALHGYRVRVVGTIFSVSEGSGRSVEVRVTEGVVQVERGDGKRWRVGAGESWSSAEAAPAERESARLPLTPPPRSAAPAAAAAPSAGPTFPGPPPPSPPVPSPALPAAAASPLSAGAGSPPPVVLAPDGPAAPALPAAASPPAAAPARSPSGSPPVAAPDLYDEATGFEARGDYAKAAEALEALIESGEPHGDLALYELGRLRQLHLGDPSGAIELFDRYRSRYPHGALEPEAGLSIIQAELARGELARARTEMDRFLAGHPGSERAEEVHLLRGNVLRESQQCAAAIADYRLCRDPKLADDALYFTAWCDKRLGRTQAAAASLHEYLERFPAGRHLEDVRQALRPAE